MGDQKTDLSIKLTHDNWNLWDHYVKSTIRCKNTYVAFRPMPVNPCALQQAAANATATPTLTVTPQPSPEELKAYCGELKDWEAVNNVVAGVILGLISEEVEHIINLEESAKDMYDKLKAKILKQLSRSSTYST